VRKRLRRPSPALVVALIALFVALGGTTYAATSLPENSVGTAQIKNGAVTKEKIAKNTRASLRGSRGARGATGQPGANGIDGRNGSNGTNGANGTSVTSATLNAGDAHCPNGGSSFTSASGTTYACNGAKGDKGDTGAQGPGGQIVTFDATATAAPTPTTLGTFLGDTISAACTGGSGAATLEIFMQTTDGSWTADYTELNGSSFPSFTPYANSEDYAAGSLSSPTEVFSVAAGSGGGQKSVTVFNFVQLGPSPGSMTWHLQATYVANGAGTCHMSVQAFPETLTTTSG
jgi:hypothetical protein